LGKELNEAGSKLLRQKFHLADLVNDVEIRRGHNWIEIAKDKLVELFNMDGIFADGVLVIS
jgi:hypothetical protein